MLGSRVELEAAIRDLTGGTQPKIGDTLHFTEFGWQFRRNLFLGAFQDDPTFPEEGTFWFNITEMRLKGFVFGELVVSPEWTIGGY